MIAYLRRAVPARLPSAGDSTDRALKPATSPCVIAYGAATIYRSYLAESFKMFSTVDVTSRPPTGPQTRFLKAGKSSDPDTCSTTPSITAVRT